VSYLKPYTTLGIGIAIGWFVLPKVVARIGG
jgi:hypothetical protein